MTTIGSLWPQLASSLLGRAGGIVRCHLLDADGLAALRDEAFTRHATATEARQQQPVDEDTTRGNPARWLESAPAGPRLDTFYGSEHILRALRQLTGVDWTPSGGQGTYSYYRRAGHHLDVHRDIDICDLAVITCVYDDRAGAGPSGQLVAYPSRTAEPVSAIRSRQFSGAELVPLQPGDSVAIFGGLVPHQVTPLGAGRVRVVAPLCYRAVGTPRVGWSTAVTAATATASSTRNSR